MSTVTVSIDRTSLGKEPLVIADDGEVYQFTDSGVGYVTKTVRTEMLPDSRAIDGSEVLSYALEATALPLEFHVWADSSAGLAAAVAELEEALYRLDYPVTRTVDGVSQAWSGAPCLPTPSRASVLSGVVAQHFDTFSVSIPFPNPHPIS